MSRIIVSLTSYPSRIRDISKVLDSIMVQTYLPDKVVLYLSEKQFPKRKLPVDLSAYFTLGLEIHWCQDDMKSHKKYLYAFKEYPKDSIITIDDDVYYEKHMIEEFVQCIDKYPQCILARRTHLITIENDGSISPYERWWGECLHYIGIPRMDLFAVGCGGILYPPNLLTQEVLNTDSIKKHCMYADDIWLKVMELISGIPVVQVQTRILDRFNKEFAQDGLYQHYNGNGGNDRSFHHILGIYDYSVGPRKELVRKLFSTGIVHENEIIQGRKNDNIRLVEECIGSIGRDTGIVIYGAGTVARRVYNALDKYKRTNKIRAFLVEDTNKNASNFKDIKVVQYKDADYENVVCIIAVADLEEQYRISLQLVAVGVRESQIRFLNYWMLGGLQDLMDAG
ncbi:hypothetical protein IMSAGC019_03561 [Lachnospiraceae bacterium]|nr:hypothetical protein IMSAGC019_03561 [Lachnospiraceae bacterium]